MESNADRFRFAGWPEPAKPKGVQHRGIPEGGQWCTDNDCPCQFYREGDGPYVVPQRDDV